jgi:hypothetical protein
LRGVALVESDLAEAARGGRYQRGSLRKQTEGIAGRDVVGGGIEQVLPVLCAVLEFGRGRGIA